jgi:hypothetical protein
LSHQENLTLEGRKALRELLRPMHQALASGVQEGAARQQDS